MRAGRSSLGDRAGLRARVRGARRRRPSTSGAGGMEGHERLCRVRGTAARAADRLPRPARALVGHGRLGPDRADALARRVARRRAVGRLLGGPAGGRRRATPTRRAGARCSTPTARWPMGDPRLSTTYDGDGHQRRAGLELWVGEEDDYPRRGAGQVLCGSSVELGPLRARLRVLRVDARRPRGRRALRRAAARLKRPRELHAGVEGALDARGRRPCRRRASARSGAPTASGRRSRSSRRSCPRAA